MQGIESDYTAVREIIVMAVFVTNTHGKILS